MVANIWVTILLKEWIDETNAAATILIGPSTTVGGIKSPGSAVSQSSDHSIGTSGAKPHIKEASVFRMNKKEMNDTRFALRNAKNRKTYNAVLEFKKELVFDLFPFQVFSLVCELELQGTKGNEKYNLSVPKYSTIKEHVKNVLKNQSSDNLTTISEIVYLTNFLSVKEDIYERAVRGSQEVHVSEEKTSEDESYYPKVHIRFLEIGPIVSKAFLFYAPFTVLWILSILSRLSADSNTDPNFLATVSSVVLTIIVASQSMIDITNWREIAVFNVAVMSYILMIIPNFEYSVYIPGALFLWLPIAYTSYLLWLPQYTTREEQFNNDPDMKAIQKKVSNHCDNPNDLMPVPLCGKTYAANIEYGEQQVDGPEKSIQSTNQISCPKSGTTRNMSPILSADESAAYVHGGRERRMTRTDLGALSASAAAMEQERIHCDNLDFCFAYEDSHLIKWIEKAAKVLEPLLPSICKKKKRKEKDTSVVESSERTRTESLLSP